MNDYIYRTTAFSDQVRVLAATSKYMANEVVRIHGTSPVATAALSRTLTAAAMLGSLLKNDEDLLSIIIKGDGGLGSIVVTADAKSKVKGYVKNPQCVSLLKQNNKIDLRTALGSGTLTLVRDMGLKEPYSGQIQLVSGEIADDLTYYFAKSEQTPTSFALGELINPDLSVEVSGGLFIQLLPGADEGVGEIIHEMLTELPPLSELLLAGETPETIVEAIFGEYDLALGEKFQLEYSCNCSKDKMEKALISIGRDDLNTIIKEDKSAEIHCHFCNEKYIFNERELIALYDRI